LKQVFGHEFVTCQTVGKILLENHLTDKLKFSANIENILQDFVANQLKCNTADRNHMLFVT